MRFDIFKFFKRFPMLATILLLGLSFYTASKALDEAKFEGIIGGLQIHEATVTEAYTKQVRQKFRGYVDACYVKSKNDEGQHDTRIDCDDQNKYDVGSTIELVQDSGRFEALSFEKGNFYFDLLLFAAEIFGIFYYFRLTRQPKPIRAY